MIEQSKKGYLTLAFGKNFAEMAVDMALSIKQFDSKPVSCVVDSIKSLSSATGVGMSPAVYTTSLRLGSSHKVKFSFYG